MSRYHKLLQEALNQSPIQDCSMAREEIENLIKEISDQLRGPLANADRLMLCADRSELRATLKRMEAIK